jgi:hypothetical protein
MTRLVAFLVLVSALGLLVMRYAEGQTPDAAPQTAPPCVKRATLVAHLANKFEERVRVIGIAENGTAFELFESPGGETWTAFITMANGVSCLVATGTDLTILPRNSGRGT